MSSGSRKGISPVIASVLVVLIVVGLISSYLVWSQRTFSGITGRGEEAVERTTQELFSDFEIQGAKDQRVFIKNTGSSELSASALDVFYSGEPIEYSADFDTLAPDDLGTITLRGLWQFGPGEHTVEITAGSFSDSAGMRATPHRSRVGDWRFEEGSGTTAEDQSGNGNDGTLQGDPEWVDNTPIENSGFALELDGDGDMVEVQDDSSLDVVNEVTIEAWINPDSLGLIQVFLDKLNSGAGYRFYADGNDMRGLIDSDTITEAGILSDDSWQHVVMSFDGSTIRLYLDGQEIQSGSATGITTHDQILSIGARKDNSRNFDGTMDEVRVYNSARTPNELYSLELR